MLKKFCLVVFSLWISGCHFLNPNVMFKTGPAYPYTNFSNSAPTEYKIAPRDIIGFYLYTNDGTKLIDIGLGTVTAGGKAELTYLVEIDGVVKLPVLGRVKMDGLTLREAEKMLEEKYSKYFVNPFVIITVSNRRVMIFPGNGGMARVLVLQNENTTLLEAITEVGGIPVTGKAHRIKIIRNNAGKTEVQLIDLSTIQNMKDANIVLQANDIIYIQPAARPVQGVLNAITPILTLLTTILLSVAIYKQFTPSN